MKYLMMLALALTGCNVEIGGITPEFKFNCPYDWETIKVVEPQITGITYADWKHMKVRSGMRWGYYNPDDSSIVLFNNLSERGEEETYQHEVCHAYQITINERTIEEEAEHARPWKVSKPNLPYPRSK